MTKKTPDVKPNQAEFDALIEKEKELVFPMTTMRK